MRAILVDWLVEVQESFELNHETLYTAVKILDLYMANKVVNKEELQLVGATACLIACKIDERFVYIIFAGAIVTRATGPWDGLFSCPAPKLYT